MGLIYQCPVSCNQGVPRVFIFLWKSPKVFLHGALLKPRVCNPGTSPGHVTPCPRSVLLLTFPALFVWLCWKSCLSVVKAIGGVGAETWFFILPSCPYRAAYGRPRPRRSPRVTLPTVFFCRCSFRWGGERRVGCSRVAPGGGLCGFRSINCKLKTRGPRNAVNCIALIGRWNSTGGRPRRWLGSPALIVSAGGKEDWVTVR